MSLRVWLPLNGNLDNQGLDQVTVTNNGAVVDNNGKIGKCYSFDGSDDGIRIDGDIIPQLQQNNFSICFWLFSNDAGDRSIYIATTPASDWGFSIEKTTANKLRVYWQGNPDFNSSLDIPDQQWCHIAVVIKDGNCYCYKNGEKLAERTSGDMTPAKLSRAWIYAQLGRDTRTGTTVLKGKMNDFRWYDHALSPLEVKQISQGLVLHYPLNRGGLGQENLVWNSNWNLHSTNPPENWTNWGSPPTREIVTINGKNWLHVISNTATFQGYSQNWAKRNGVGELSAGQKVTVSFTAYLAVAASIAPIGIHWCNSSGTIISQNWTTTALTTNPKRYSFTYTTPANCVAFNIMIGDNTNTAHEVWITDIKLEESSIATPWCPNSSDELYSTLGLNDNIQYDTSGYGNNGTKINTLTYSSDTPKYNISTHFGATNQKIHIENLITTGFLNSYSFAWWGKRTSNSPMFWGFSNGVRLNGMFLGNLWNTGDGSNNPIYKPGTTTQITAPSLNIWHHYVMTGDGTTCKLYLDGELYGQAKTYKSITGTSIFINGWDSGTSYCHDNMDMSDFRIYATALSAQDVFSLYNNSAYIDNQGNIYGAVYEEA